MGYLSYFWPGWSTFQFAFSGTLLLLLLFVGLSNALSASSTMEQPRRPRVDRWLGLSASMIMLVCSGLTYTYSIYSEHLKGLLHYTQEQTDKIGAAKDFGSILGLLLGFLYSFYPPWVTVCIGALLHFIGYGMVWMTLVGAVPPSFWLLCTYFTLGAGGDSYIDTACITTSLQSFGKHRGTAVAILQAQVGLSGAIFVLMYEVFFEPDVDKYILLVTLAPSFASFALAFYVRPYPPAEQDKDVEDVKQRFRLAYGILIFLGIFLMVVVTIKAVTHPGKPILAIFAIIVLLVASTMFTIPLMQRPVDLLLTFISCEGPGDPIEEMRLTELPRRNPRHRKQPFTPELEDIHEGEEKPLKSSSDWDSDDDIIVFENKSADSEIPAEATLLQSLLGIDFWLVTLAVMVGAGSGLAIINNFAQIGKALGDDAADVHVGLISIWSCFGRLFAGYGSDLLLKWGYPRPACLFLAQLAMSSCCLLLSTGRVPLLYVGSALVGLAYGSLWSLQPPIVAEVFGLQHFSTLYKINSAFGPFGAYLLSTKVVGFLYDKQADLYKNQAISAVEENECLGPHCFRSALLWLAFVCALSMFGSLWFTIRTRRLYVSQQP